MTFYQSIANHYEQIFPLNKIQLDFIKKSFDDTSKLSILDIGCGTGCLSNELAGLFSKVTAIDLDEAMLEKAIVKNDKGIHFQKLNMLDIEKEFGQQSFDAVVCFGNTLVHLDGSGQVLDFFRQARRMLKKNGKLLFQVINYDRIIDQKIMGLPTIENDEIQFMRNYHYDTIKNKVDFETQLLIKETGQKISNLIFLYPLRINEIKELLKAAGFADWQLYGNFKKEKLTKNSLPLVAIANY